MAEHGLLVDAFVYLAATVIFVPIASRLKLGSVLGYLVAGCIIGPWGIKLVENVESIMHFAEFGVVLMLFVIGLELDPRRLWAMRRAVFGGGGLQLLLSSVPLFGVAMLLGLHWQAALVASLSLALSSTAIVVQTMNERNIQATPVGRTTFSILLFQDIAAIPLIGLVPLLSDQASSESGGPVWLSALKIIAAIAAVVVVGLYATRPTLRFVAKIDSRELFTAFTLMLVVGIALLMSFVGVSMALGAFLAGVLLASSEYKHALETDIEPFKGLLMGLFFIAVGMSINFGLLSTAPLLVLGLLAAVVGFKLVMLRLFAPLFGVSKVQGILFGSLLSQAGEFAFVVFGVAREARILPGNWDAILTLVVALSMATTPLLLVLHDFLAARKTTASKREADVIDSELAPVIIAGFGRFGQIIGRLLFASGLTATVLDHDPDQIELLKPFGFRVFYGDATRLDLLHSAGAGRARAIVVAVDGVDECLEIVDIVRANFPALTIVARARNVTHYIELRKRGVTIIERETFEAALALGRKTLESLGVSPYEVKERSDRFRRHNIAMLEAILPHMADASKRVSLARQAREELEEQFRREQQLLARPESAGWRLDLDDADDSEEAAE
ncbi:MAG: glutathione-regulated potassium-efflux system protein KefC [Sandaracinaceae bacterium]|jgi:glutathione-regulated potassium-efflux system ancillary protein KefC|nr:glutathione-regulated potassium-efflux system protein KefC [Sandaracinaceae bacterium]